MEREEIYQQYMYSYPHKTAYRTLEGVDIRTYLPRLEQEKNNSLYFHIPFCQAKCGYCNLFSVTGKGMDYVDTYTVNMEDYSGKRFTITFDIPKFKNNRFMKLRGNEKVMSGQLFHVPSPPSS